MGNINIDRLEKMYKKFNSYVNKNKRIGLYDDDKKAICQLMADIVHCEMIIIDDFFDDLILPDIMDDDCVEWASEIDMLIGWDLGRVDDGSIRVIKDTEYVYGLMRQLQFRLNNNLIKNIKKMEESGYLEDILSLLNKYIEGKNNLDICQKYINNRFFDVYTIMEENNEKVKENCRYRECK